MKLWCGLGMQTGGRVIVGMSKTIGVIYSMNDPLEKVRSSFVLSEAVSVGLALGGGVGTVFIVAWGYNQVEDIDDVHIGELDLALDLGVKDIGGYLKSLYEVGKAGTAAKYAGTICQFAEKFEKSKDLSLEMVKNVGLNISRPGQAIIAIPGAGVGLQAAVAWQASSLQVTQSMMVNFKDSWSVKEHIKTVASL